MKLVDIGRLRKPFGVQGHIKVEVKDQYLESLLSSKVVFVKTADGDIPYFVDEVKSASVTTVKFEDVDSPEQASRLSMASIALRADDVTVSEDHTESNTLLLLAGFSLYDKGQLVGEIEEVVEYPQQIMARVKVDREIVLIPLPDEFVKSVDVEARSLQCDLPEGLVSSQL